MEKTVISYSLTGNNGALAREIASRLSAEHITVEEKKERTMGTVMMDMIFHRTPKVSLQPNRLDLHGYTVFVGPVWMGKSASPLRAVFEVLKGTVGRYAFVSISGGADGPNPQLESDLTERMGTKPAAVVDLHIADLLPKVPKPRRKDTSAYRLNDEEVKVLSAKALNALESSMLRQEGRK